MFYKEPELNKKGQPICEFCKVGYDRLLRHVSHRHEIKSAEYKTRFGYHPRKGIVSKKLAVKAKRNALKNYNTVVMQNLIIGGHSTRFKNGNTATNRSMVSKIASARMSDYWESKKETQQEIVSKIIKILSFQNKSSLSVRSDI